MDQTNILDAPKVYSDLVSKSKEVGFTMPSDLYIGTLLKTLVASKRGGSFLELGTGMGLSLAWILDGMDKDSCAISLDNDGDLIDIAKEFFHKEARLKLFCCDGEVWLKEYTGDGFDLIFADAWPGKYSTLDKALSMVNMGGYYVIDDMKKQPNWPDGHEELAKSLVDILEKREDFVLTKMDWSTGVIVAVKIK
ncbi:O-methyltransferase [Flagellimonas flava]|uniref:Predicted O-methyltransferase YrrM n=1 Tax=Flagellimonas flava TaxID=570519 RepID=A0A1M5IG03_9FLAO|nr:SAM-dependent methyltransferase [Allomuricauda flava]SHG27222.1 Predicted O-methyltransferase YrrM [Allomuricauda flava]